MAPCLYCISFAVGLYMACSHSLHTQVKNATTLFDNSVYTLKPSPQLDNNARIFAVQNII